jgi:hypothetical protein
MHISILLSGLRIVIAKFWSSHLRNLKTRKGSSDKSHENVLQIFGLDIVSYT